MRFRKRTIVRVETRHLTVIRPAGSVIELWCEQCAGAVSMVTPEDAARLCDATPRTIYRMVEEGKVHFEEIKSGGLLVCINSLGQG
jgi:hypothetical protein